MYWRSNLMLPASGAVGVAAPRASADDLPGDPCRGRYDNACVVPLHELKTFSPRGRRLTKGPVPTRSGMEGRTYYRRSCLGRWCVFLSGGHLVGPLVQLGCPCFRFRCKATLDSARCRALESQFCSPEQSTTPRAHQNCRRPEDERSSLCPSASQQPPPRKLPAKPLAELTPEMS